MGEPILTGAASARLFLEVLYRPAGKELVVADLPNGFAHGGEDFIRKKANRQDGGFARPVQSRIGGAQARREICWR